MGQKRKRKQEDILEGRLSLMHPTRSAAMDFQLNPHQSKINKKRTKEEEELEEREDDKKVGPPPFDEQKK